METSNEVKDNILIVDDMENNRFTLKGIIEKMGYRPLLAENGEQALKVLTRIKPVLILLDIAMPGMDGFEVCKKIKEDVEIRDVPVIFISAFGEVEDMIKGYEIGAAEYITKPFIPQVVEARVRLLIQLAKNNEELKEMNQRLQISVLQQSERAQSVKENILHRMMSAWEKSYVYDSEYADRLGANSRLIAEALQMSTKYEDEISDRLIESISDAARLCNIGYISLPSDLVYKQNRNSEEEEKFRAHTSIGAEMINEIGQDGDYKEYTKMASDIANYHHECFDGSGYPSGKKNKQIPLPAQIVGICDAYCSLTHSTESDEGLSSEEALSMMTSDMKDKFNPDILDVLTKVSRQLK